MSGAIFFGFEPFSPSPVKGWLRNDVFTNHCCHSSEKPWYGNIYTPTSPGRQPEVFFVAPVAVHFGRGNRFFSIHPFLCQSFPNFSQSNRGLSEVKGKGLEKKGRKVVPLPVNRHIVEFLGSNPLCSLFHLSQPVGWLEVPPLVPWETRIYFHVGFSIAGGFFSRPDSDQELPQKSHSDPGFVSQSTLGKTINSWEQSHIPPPMKVSENHLDPATFKGDSSDREPLEGSCIRGLTDHWEFSGIHGINKSQGSTPVTCDEFDSPISPLEFEFE